MKFYWVTWIVVLIAIIVIGLGTYAMIDHSINCEKVKVCYKVGCSAWGCSEARVDCSSSNVDKTRMRCGGIGK